MIKNPKPTKSPTPGTKAVFLDRDGVINVDKGYIHRWEEFEFLPGAIEAMHRFASAGYALIIVTNQSGLARGFYSFEEYQVLSKKLSQYLYRVGILLKAIYHCPHHPEGAIDELAITCECRKPAPGMLIRAQRDHGLDLTGSVLVGDKVTDMEAGKSAGVGSCFLVMARGIRPMLDCKEFEVVDSLWECANRLNLD